jgi:hypothetical protein
MEHDAGIKPAVTRLQLVAFVTWLIVLLGANKRIELLSKAYDTFALPLS